jgi:Flp pilus assembly CpaF family ATPase
MSIPLEEYVEKGAMTEREREALVKAVVDRRNILIGGDTATGKTTLANALLRVVADQTPDDHVFIAQNNPELECTVRSLVSLRTYADSARTRLAIRAALKKRPDRIVVGELRDETAIELLEGWIRRPGGIATVWGKDPIGMLNRICKLSEDTSHPANPHEVAKAVNVCVHIARDPTAAAGRRLRGLLRITGFDEKPSAVADRAPCRITIQPSA